VSAASDLPKATVARQASRLKLCVEEFTSRDKAGSITETRQFHHGRHNARSLAEVNPCKKVNLKVALVLRYIIAPIA
jgi:hypothetical protein